MLARFAARLRSPQLSRAALPLLVALCVGALMPAQTVTDRLPSWNDGAVKTAIVGFVERVTSQGGPDFVPPAERIATFDNDGHCGRSSRPTFNSCLPSTA